MLTHWGRVTHICFSNLTIIGSDNGLSPGRRQAIIRTNDGILLIGPLGTNFSEILIGIQTFSSKKIYLKMSFAKWRPFCLSLNVLTYLNTTLEYKHNMKRYKFWNSQVPLTHLPLVPYICMWTGSALLQVMACHLFGAKPFPEPMLTYWPLDPKEQT